MEQAPLVGRLAGSYRIDARLGAGGMGEVYRAYDTRLERAVALKVLPADTARDPDRLRRFREEARAASSLSHPHIVAVHDFGDIDGRPFIVTELVEGETIRERLRRGPVPADEATRIALQVVDALTAAHRRGLVHRDIKPDNVMIRTDGHVKVLDFGLAKTIAAAVGEAETQVTMPGAIVGTPRYMSPEQVRGLPADPKTDVWSLGVLMYELMTGRPPFDGPSFADVAASILGSDPPPLAARVPGVADAVSAVVATAMAKDASRRYATAGDLLAALHAAAAARTRAAARPERVRIIVLPLRILTSHPDSDFLAFSLPDAITSTLAALGSVVVRSSAMAARYANVDDMARVAADAAVDVVLAGTLLRAGDRVRVAAQLVDARGGSVIWSGTSDASLADVFALQDAITKTIVESMAIPLTGGDREQIRRHAPASPHAYEYYLRANELSRDPRTWRPARDMYVRAVEIEPRFAPAWARLARVHRLLAKYQGHQAGDALSLATSALDRALELNPDLTSAHHLYAQIDVDRGRAEDAMVRLLMRARRQDADADIFAALVHTLRVCGLMEASLAAHARARQLDPNVDTGVMHTYWLLHRYDDAIRNSGVKAYVAPAALAELGRLDEARAMLAEIDAESGNRTRHLAAAVRAFLDGRRDEGIDQLVAQTQAAAVSDPELLFYVGRHLSHVGEFARALPFVARAVKGGYFCYPVLATDPWLDGVRTRPEFQDVLGVAKPRWQQAAAMFADGKGPELLGLSGEPWR